MSGKAVVQAEVKSLLDADGISFDSHCLIHVVVSICKNTTFMPHVKHILHFPLAARLLLFADGHRQRCCSPSAALLFAFGCAADGHRQIKSLYGAGNTHYKSIRRCYIFLSDNKSFPHTEFTPFTHRIISVSSVSFLFYESQQIARMIRIRPAQAFVP